MRKKGNESVKSMRPKSLIFCVHAHQPVGNFDNVFEEGYQKSYLPFFEVLEKHPVIPLSCHFSGSLIDWLEKHRPEFITLLKKMSDRGQLEFIGGGYYEPIYGLIPKKDLHGQIRMMTDKIQTLFGQTVEGVWLTERVWDPNLVTPLKKAGAKFTILDDLHFEKAGMTPPVKGYYQAGQGKDLIDLFASMKQLRYLMPFRRAEEAINFIRTSEAKPEDVFVFADDCEKFGMWPGTYDWVYKERWLDKFLTHLEKDEQIAVCSFKEFRRHFDPQGVVRIPHASYSEMMEWSGGNFYNFMEKYPESRYMRDRMWSVSKALESAVSTNGSSEKLSSSRAALYRAQCNCSYWHGVFGGLYLHHLRSAVFENLIRADQWLTEIEKKGENKDSTVMRPRRLDSGIRWRVEQKELVSFFNGAYGGALEELDSLPHAVNLMCNLQRRKELYHEAALDKTSKDGHEAKPLSIHDMLGSKEKNISRHLFYDTHRRLSFMDHFFSDEITSEEFAKSSYAERGNFIGLAYKTALKESKGLQELCFERKGFVTLHQKKVPIFLRKTVTSQGRASLCVHYSITNESACELTCAFGIECNFSIGETQAMKGLNERNVKEWTFNDAWRGIRIKLRSREAMNLIASPVETVSESESGLERTYQELGVLLQKNFILKAHETVREDLELSVES